MRMPQDMKRRMLLRKDEHEFLLFVNCKKGFNKIILNYLPFLQSNYKVYKNIKMSKKYPRKFQSTNFN